MRYIHLSLLEALGGTTVKLRITYHPGVNAPLEPAVQLLYSAECRVPQSLVGAEARELLLFLSEFLYDETENAPTV